MTLRSGYCFFFFNDTATTEIYTLSLHDALPICRRARRSQVVHRQHPGLAHERHRLGGPGRAGGDRSEEHTSELQSQSNLVCRLLLEKKKKTSTANTAAPRRSCITLQLSIPTIEP